MLRIGDIRAGFVSHTTFLFGAPDGTTILTDPYFCGEFAWQKGAERHLQRPDIRPESIERCDAIFVSHIHGDHCDAHAIETIVKNTSARVFAPPDVVEALSQLGIPNSALATTSDGQTIRVGAIDLEIQGGYDDSFDSKGRMNKFSLLATLGATTIWYSGDCHALPPALQGRRLDAVFCWSSPDVVAHIARITPPPKRFVIMHHDKHEPGMFWCSRDAAQDALALSEKLPGVEVLVPDRLGSFAAFASSR